MHILHIFGYRLLYIICMFVNVACNPSTSPQPSDPHISLSAYSTAAQRTDHQYLFQQAIRRCQGEPLWSCKSWYLVYAQVTKDLRKVRVNAPLSMTLVGYWIDDSLDMIKRSSPLAQNIGAEVIAIIVERLRFRSLPKRAVLKKELMSLVHISDNPIHTAKLITTLNHLIPMGEGDFFYNFIKQDLPVETQVAAWEVIAKRHSDKEKIKLSQIRKVIKNHPTISVKASLINAVKPFKTSKVIGWCGKEWWHNELFIPCRNALSYLGNERAAYELWKWVKTIFEEVDQAINADQSIAEALTYLSACTRSPRSQRRYKKILDRFFSRRRSETAAILVSQSWLNLPSKRFAMEISLRYFRPKLPKIVAQSHFFEQNLKRIIYQLSHPSHLK